MRLVLGERGLVHPFMLALAAVCDLNTLFHASSYAMQRLLAYSPVLNSMMHGLQLCVLTSLCCLVCDIQFVPLE